MAQTILYVEDNLENQILVRRVLESEGYKILIAEDGLSGIRMAQEHDPDLILMDINLPGMDGYAAARRIKSIERLRAVPIVALTANVLHGARERVLAAGCDGYLQKPIDIDLLQERVKEFLQDPTAAAEEIGGDEKLMYVERLATDLVSKLETQVRELEQANEELRQLDRMKSEFVSIVSHELRTPLNIIIGHGEVLEDKMFGPLNGHQQRYVSNIVRSARHLYDLVQDILDLSKIESGRLSLHRQRFSLEEALEEIRVMMAPLAEQKELYFSFQIEGGVEHIIADRLRFKQIIQNLLSNAIKFTPQGGSVICIISRPFKGIVQLEVIDTGIGIALEDQAIIFERFRQVDSSASREGEGTGLGLALTRQFVELHGGTISVKSQSQRGSTFTVILPQEE
ncbi:MAG: hybrid sensor histidine kinase/response regulator [Ardenticatenaceae bacterium]